MLLLLLVVHHALVVTTVMVGCVAARLRWAPQGRLLLVLLLAIATLIVEHVVRVRILWAFHHFYSLLVFFHFVDVHFVFFQVLHWRSMMEVIVAFVVHWNSVTMPYASSSIATLCSVILLIIIGAWQQCIIPGPILTAEHLGGCFLVDGLCSPQVLLILLKLAPLLLNHLLVGRVALFEPLCVPQCVQSVIARRAARADASEHNDLYFVAGEEGVPQHHRQLTLPEWHVLALCRLTFLSVDGSDALLQSEERLVDLCALLLSILRVIYAVWCTFATCQIHKKKLAALFDSFFLNLDLADSMTATRSVVRLRRVRRPHSVPLVNQLNDLLLRAHKVLREALNLNLLALVFEDLENLVIVEQVVDFTAIDFIHWYSHGEVSLIVLPVVDTALEQVLHSVVLKTLHGESLTGTCLTVSENCDGARVEDEVKDGLNAKTIELFIWLRLAESIVEFESLIVDEFCDAVDLVLAVVDDDFGVRDGCYVDLSAGELGLENWPLLYAHINLQLVCWDVLLSWKWKIVSKSYREQRSSLSVHLLATYTGHCLATPPPLPGSLHLLWYLMLHCSLLFSFVSFWFHPFAVGAPLY